MENTNPGENVATSNDNTSNTAPVDDHSITRTLVDNQSEAQNDIIRPSIETPIVEQPGRNDVEAHFDNKHNEVEMHDIGELEEPQLPATDMPEDVFGEEQLPETAEVPEPIIVEDQSLTTQPTKIQPPPIPEGADIIDLDDFVLSVPFSDRACKSFSPGIKVEGPEVVSAKTPEVEIQHQHTPGRDQQDAIIIDGGDPPVIKEEDGDVQFLWSILPTGTINLVSDDEDEPIVSTKQPSTANDGAPMGDNTATAVPAGPAVNPKKRLFPASVPIVPLTFEDQLRLDEFQRQFAERNVGTRKPAPNAASPFSNGPTRRKEKPVQNYEDVDIEDRVLPEGKVAQGAEVAGTVADEAAEETLDSSSETDDGSKFRALKKDFNKKKKKGDVSFEEEIAYRKAERMDAARRKRLELDEQHAQAEDNEDSLFLADPRWNFPGKRTQATMDPSLDDMDEEEADFLRQKKLNENAKANKLKRMRQPVLIPTPRNNVSAKERDASMLLGLQATLDKESKKAAAKRRAASGKKKPTANGESGNSRSKKRKATAEVPIDGSGTTKKIRPSKKRKGPEMTNLTTLVGGNVIAEAQANANLGDQGTSKAKNKEVALAELIASTPEGSRKTASVDRRALLRATRSFAGRGNMKADQDKGWKLKGMTSSLYHYQLLGAAFMRDRELGDEQPLGGICADEMGFGKTVMMIANILDGRPPPKDDIKTTLIVATPSLVTQWMREIEFHCEPGVMGEVMRYHAGARVVSNNTVESLKRSNIILTTYSEVAKSYPKCEYPEKLTTPEDKHTWWKKHFEKHKGPLHRIMFHRVVLDEAQAIKNHQSRTSIACRGLVARHRWAISGTPIQNRIEEFYPYFSFLRVKHTGTFETFKKNFCPKGKSELGLERLHEFLRIIMIRRTHLEQIFGKPILKLPASDQRTCKVQFSDLERAIYQIVRLRFIQRINGYSADGVLDKKYRHIFTMALRLRQLTGHIFMIQETIEDLLEQEDIEKLMHLASMEVADDTPNGRSILQLRTVLAARKPVESDTDTPNSSPPAADSNIGGEFGTTTVNFKKYLRHLHDTGKWAELKARSLCPQCRQPPDTPWVTSCNHVYCAECLKSMIYDVARNKRENASCKECGVIFTSSEPASGLDELEFDGLSPSTSSSQSNETRRKRKKDSNSENEVTKWIDVDGHILPSAKTLAIKAQILNWLSDAPKEKIIIFTQFHEMWVFLQCICLSFD